MESPQPLLSVESFSYRWLVKLDRTPAASFRKSFDDAADEASSFIEMDPTMPPSRRFSVTSYSHDFKFDFPAVQFPLDVVHADDLFAGGHLLPLFSDPAKVKHPGCGSSDPALPSVNDSQDAYEVVTWGSGNTPVSFTESCQQLPKQIFPKRLNFLETFCKIFRLRRLSFRTKLGRKRGHGTRNWVYPEEFPSCSPRISSAFSTDDGRKSSISECSIYEAVLHCKKSIGREMD
ncbi:hypothetical protein MLD38_015697 [Melastoma candidum]|uniref:Uncharacterized protein n=1 Tax=Melastoma candidum TaxID=119954 RepID=A0ACB9RGK9_9MYRT|nr:hypothetical protein MLD38_015697 [Melastoma candidum]